LDVYLCEAGFMGNNPFPPSILKKSVSKKLAVLSGDHFGYQLLPFEHGKDGDNDVGLSVIRNVSNPIETTMDVLPALVSKPTKPFSHLVGQINRFFEWTKFWRGNHFKQIVFCRNCRKLQLICMREEHMCPTCRSDLIKQF
jgi:hypothetical protein